ncbi:MAG: prepilin peptidase [bacterium]|nr:prepilin peptidase [bacterium]
MFFLCWGSFLNVLSYRLIRGEYLTSRSHCTTCNTKLAWYDLIPLFSWFFLRGRCRYCKKSISILYPFIELLTAISLSLLWLQFPLPFFVSYAFFFSALIITIRSDIETMLISRYVTLFLVPIGILLSAFEFLPISFYDSLWGAFVGYVSLLLIGKLFFLVTRKQGIGQGDLDLLAFIGSFCGVFGIWATVFIGSITGSIVGIIYLLITRTQQSLKIPFGPFLAGGALLFVFFQQTLTRFLFYTLI